MSTLSDPVVSALSDAAAALVFELSQGGDISNTTPASNRSRHLASLRRQRTEERP